MKNQTLNNAFPIVAAALGNKFGVKVMIGGEDAYTDGKTINLPAYNSDNPDYQDIAWGYLAHEAGHVRFSDFVEFKNAATSPLRKRVVNALEDIRIEKAMHNLYPGTKLTIQKLDEYLCKAGEYEMVTVGSHPAAILTQYLFLRLSADVLGYSALSSYADSVETVLETTFPEGAVTRLMGLLSEVPRLDSTRSCVRLTDRILRMIEEEKEKEQENARQAQAQAEQDDQAASGQQEAPVGQDADGNQDPTPDGPDQDDHGQNPGQSASSSDADGDEQDQQPGMGSENTGDDPMDNQDSGQFAQTLASVLDADEGDLPQDVFEMARQLLGDQPKNCYDHEMAMPIAVPAKKYPGGKDLIDKVMGESGKIRASLQGLVQSSQAVRNQTKRSGNRVVGSKLYRLAQGDSRVFGKEARRHRPNTAIHLLVDYSGSMDRQLDPANPGCQLVNIALDSAVALALALEGIPGVNPAITRFPFGDTDNVVELLKHGEKVRQNASVFMPIADGAGTPLHTALWYAAASVLSTREERKVILVLTDGEPDSVDATRAIIRRCEATGIELVGVGICFDTRHLFGRSIIVNKVSDLRTELFRIGKDLLAA